ncbi:zinc finger CW-type PWWP domain protein 1 isoform X4 [Chelonoidis abingdonii]|uniref:zinc finger CW-type PWWP domain protein 1 isoform X4 n=1 Tax=Chelonoidis abingdonii TaxID=106734 RepID=UPI003F4928F1
MMKKTFAPPLAKPHVLSLREGPEHHVKKGVARAKEAIIHTLSQGHPDIDVKRWKKCRVAKEEDTGHVKGPATPQDVENKPKRSLTKASAKEMCHLTDLQFEEIVQSVLQKSLQECMDQCVAWVQCSYPSCEKWRRLSSDTDPSVLPEDWTCSQNTDLQYKSCDVPEETWSGSENEVVYATYVPGSIIWAKQFGYPWWPAMVECDPDIGEYFLFSSRLDSLPSKYHVTFFGQSVSRAWISATMLRNFHEFSTESLGLKTLRSKDYRQKLDSAVRMAKEAERISIQERVTRFGFVSRSSEGGLLEAHKDSEELFNMAQEPSEEKQPCDGNENMVATSDFEEKTFLKGLKKKFTILGSNSSGSSQPKSAAGGNRVNLTPSRHDSLKLELVKTLQVKDNTTRSHPRSSSSDEIFEEFQELGELEKAKEARGSQKAEKNESSEESCLVLFEE